MTTRKEKAAEFDQGYNVIVTGRHIHVTQAMKEYATERVSKLEKIANHIIDVQITMDIQKHEQRVDVLMKYGHTIIRSYAATNDMYVSTDVALDKLQRQLMRYKKRLQDHHAKGHPVVEIPVKVIAASNELDEVNDQIDDESLRKQSQEKTTTGESAASSKIASHDTKPIRILTEDEAVMKMDLSQDSVIIFRAEEDKTLKVIYRRVDGTYGIVAPEL